MPPPPPGGRGTMSLARGTAGLSDLMAQDSGGPNQAQLPLVAPPQQGAAQIAVQPAAGRAGAGTAQPPPAQVPLAPLLRISRASQVLSNALPPS